MSVLSFLTNRRKSVAEMVAESELARLRAIADAWQREAVNVRENMDVICRYLGSVVLSQETSRHEWVRERNQMLADLERKRRRVGELEYVIGGLQSQLAELDDANRRLKSQLRKSHED